MRLLASVHSLVNSESRSLDESLVAFGVVANVRSDSGVNTFCEDAIVRKPASYVFIAILARLTMTRQVASSGETFAAGTTGVCFDRCCGSLLLLGLLRHVMHSHAWYTSHTGHVCKASHLHSIMHVILHLHRSLHGGWRRIGARHAVRRVRRMLRHVR